MVCRLQQRLPRSTPSRARGGGLMDRPDYLSHDDAFQGMVKAARSKFCTPTATPRKHPALLLSVLSVARVGTFQMTERQNGPSRSRCRTGSPKLLRLTLLCSQKRLRLGSLILLSECNARLTSSQSRPWSRSAPSLAAKPASAHSGRRIGLRLRICGAASSGGPA
jgi:hypothetical protein